MARSILHWTVLYIIIEEKSIIRSLNSLITHYESLIMTHIRLTLEALVLWLPPRLALLNDHIDSRHNTGASKSDKVVVDKINK